MVGPFLQEDEHGLHRQPLHDAAKGADERSREGHVAVQHRHGAEPGIDLDELDFQALVFEKAARLSDVVRRVGITSARQGNADLLRLRVERTGKAEQRHH